MIAALADAGAALGRADYLAAAVTCASFVETELRDASGGLLRTFNRGRAKQPAFLEDHAYLLEAYLVLYESTFDERWFVRAVELAETILIRFHDPERGGFFSTAADHEGLIARRKDLEDAPIPSGASAACYGLLRLAHLTGEVSYEEAALSLIELLHTVAPTHPLAFGHLLRAIDFIVSPVREVALAGDDVSALAAVVRRGFYPHVVLAGGAHSTVPLLAGPRAGRRRTRRLRLRGFTCQLPVTSAKNWQSRCKAKLFRHISPCHPGRRVAGYSRKPRATRHTRRASRRPRRRAMGRSLDQRTPRVRPLARRGHASSPTGSAPPRLPRCLRVGPRRPDPASASSSPRSRPAAAAPP